ncbi:hypothetical protein HUA74_41350 [Myxococcus sp. CA051A]|uniref:hypothetical protein n=1 Tax=Myxococcus sp. CA051A TaxID=2741739 RepID=UPI00157B6F34|nr:hypothetical protein [Myxococcus sp. CA051A]NTX67114.1 hypothetical protein [Myxococcus sp. CA051A]
MNSIFRLSSALWLVALVAACDGGTGAEVATPAEPLARFQPLELNRREWTATHGGVDGFGDLAVQPDGHTALVGTANSDILVARFDPQGQLLWSRRFGDENYQQATGISVDSEGNLVITGDYWGLLDFGGGPLPCRGEPGYPRAFVAKFAASGEHVWSRCFGDGGQQQTGTLAVASDGDVYVSGYFAGSIDYGDGPIPAKGPLNQFVVRLAGSSGAPVWNNLYEAGPVSTLASLAVDAAGNLFISSGYVDTLSFHGVPWLSAPGFNVYVLKLDAHGEPLWAKSFGPLRNQTFWRLAADPSGNVVATGAFIGTVDHGGGPLSSGDGDVFVVSLDGEGHHRWSRSFGGPGFDWGYDVDVDFAGSVVVTGSFSTSIDFGEGLLTSAGGEDIFVAKLGRDGETRWGRAFGDVGNQSAMRVGSAGLRDVVLWGRLVGTLDFGSGPVTGRSSSDSFVTRITPP